MIETSNPVARILLVVGYCVLCFILLSVTYPISDRFAQMVQVSHTTIIFEYLFMSLIVTFIGLVGVPVLTLWAKESRLNERFDSRGYVLYCISGVWVLDGADAESRTQSFFHKSAIFFRI
ncbi:MAG: hypothetical protein AB1757_27270 [Acidobacteriota bacterium]